MAVIETVRAWKDQEYRDTLTAEQQAQIPEHPSGLIEFGKPQLEDESLFGPVQGRCKILSNAFTNKSNHCYTSKPGQCK